MVDFLWGRVSSLVMLAADPEEKAEAPSEDWMEVTTETGIKACWGVPMLPLASPRDTWSAEVPKGSEVGGSMGE